MAQYVVDVVIVDDPEGVPLQSMSFGAANDDDAFLVARDSLLPDLVTGPGQYGVLYSVLAGRLGPVLPRGVLTVDEDGVN